MSTVIPPVVTAAGHDHDHPAPAAGPHTAEALLERVFTASIEAQYLAGIHIGRELGLFAALRDGGPATPPALAAATGCDTRYVREWLEFMAVGDVLAVADGPAEPDARVFALPEGHAEALLDHTSPNSAGPFGQFIVGEIMGLQRTVDVFRTGEGLSYDDFPVCRLAQAEVNRPAFIHDLGSTWIPAIPEVHRAFTERGGRVADIACGSGWSSIEMARAYPRVSVDGYDLDGPSLALARENLRGSGVENRVRFVEGDAAEAVATEGYDLVTVFEALHDMANPVEVLSTARALLAPGGAVLIADEKVAHEFAAPGDEIERLMYGFSVLFCLPTGREAQPSVATGTAMRPSTLEGYARAAGFTGVETLPIENDLWRFSLLRP
jgi:SAM-dependent methyltransferase